MVKDDNSFCPYQKHKVAFLKSSCFLTSVQTSRKIDCTNIILLAQCSTVVVTLLKGRPAKPMEMEKLGCHNSETPEPIDTKFGISV